MTSVAPRVAGLPAGPVLSDRKAFSQSQSRARSKSVGSSAPTSPTHAKGQPSAAAFASKKGKGGGGKGSWGRLEDEIWVAQNTPPSPTAGDINEVDETGLDDSGVVIVESKWDITGEEMRRFMEPKVAEFFASGDAEEVLPSIAELARPELNPQIVAFVVSEAVERSEVECELVSTLFVQLSVKSIFTMAEIQKGFDCALVELDDLILDNPHAHEALGKFMARAVADEIIAPAFVTSRPAPGDSDEAARAFAKARGLITSPQGLTRLEHVWGTNGGLSPVDELRDKVSLLLEEYLETRDMREAETCVRELHAPRFHHEVVFQAIVLAIDGRDERDVLALSALLKAMCASSLVSPLQLEKGLGRVFESMSDIQLDCPRAALNLDTFCRVSGSFLPRTSCAMAAKLARQTMNKVKGKRVRSVTLPSDI